jgi:hypothetical protein
VLREIVVNDEHIVSLFHEIFGDARRGVGRDVDKAWRIVPFGDNYHGVIHRAFFAEVGHDLGDG